MTVGNCREQTVIDGHSAATPKLPRFPSLRRRPREWGLFYVLHPGEPEQPETHALTRMRGSTITVTTDWPFKQTVAQDDSACLPTSDCLIQMMTFRKSLAIIALIPFAIGLNLQTGQNLYRFMHIDDGIAAFYGMVFELLAFVIIAISASRYAKALISMVFIIQAPLLIGWGFIVGMFTGFGDGASRGAGILDVSPWFLSGIVFLAVGILTIKRMIQVPQRSRGVQI